MANAQSVIQAQYEVLETIAQNFAAQAQASEGMTKRVRGQTGALRDSAWKGRGADAFLGEMDQRIFPTLERLTGALSEASRISQQLAKDIKQAEEEAAALFRGRGGSSAGDGRGESPAPAATPDVVDDPVKTTKT